MGWTDPKIVRPVNVSDNWTRDGYVFERSLLPENFEEAMAIAWMVKHVTDVPQGCWTCTRKYYLEKQYNAHPDCMEGRCPFPNEPKMPPRNLIVKGPKS